MKATLVKENKETRYEFFTRKLAKTLCCSQVFKPRTRKRKELSCSDPSASHSNQFWVLQAARRLHLEYTRCKTFVCFKPLRIFLIILGYDLLNNILKWTKAIILKIANEYFAKTLYVYFVIYWYRNLSFRVKLINETEDVNSWFSSNTKIYFLE